MVSIVLSQFIQGGVLVTFDQAVSWTPGPAPTLDVAGKAVSYDSQPDASSLEVQVNPDAEIGDPWSWTGPDSSLDPTPDDAQNGNVA